MVIQPKIFGDERGFFMESYHSRKFAVNGIDVEFVQDNFSRSQKGVLRGLHYQIEHAQGKLITVLQGEIFDVAVDLRKSSPTFGQWTGKRLNDQTREALYIPPGFGHGFYVLSESADVFYKCTDFYHPEHERVIAWNDPQVGIEWPLADEPTLSEKDQQGVAFSEAECFK